MPIPIKIERGLFKLDFTDQYAILGAPVDADGTEVRKRYLKIARRLHPDSCKAESEAEKQLANELFSKLVNPAYEQLYPDKGRAEYKSMLGRMGQRLALEAGKISIQSEVAKQLAKAGGNADHVYKTSLQELAKTQYESIHDILDAIAQISELNMVYLMMKQGAPQGRQSQNTTESTRLGQTGSNRPPQPPPAPPAPPVSQVESYLRRADEYLSKNLFAKAVLELRDALKLEPNNSRSHGMLGMAYLKQNQATMAKVHINKALELNPKEEIALQGKQILDRVAKTSGGGTIKTQSKPTTPPKGGGKQPDKPGGGGLFGGIFGGGDKKK